jgi:hypothetical protein
MSNIAIFSNANLPVTAVAESLKKIEQAMPSTMVILKMDKTGHWVFGADQTEVEKGTRWAVNPFSFVHGFIAWGKGEVLGEHMAPLTEPLPEVGVPPAGAERGWEQQFGFCLKALDGDDAGMEARFSATSVGGKRSVQTLGTAIANQVMKDQSRPVAVVELKNDHYQHKSYGRVFTPVFEIVDWLTMDGEQDVQKLDAPEASGGEEPRRRQRRTA